MYITVLISRIIITSVTVHSVAANVLPCKLRLLVIRKRSFCGYKIIITRTVMLRKSAIIFNYDDENFFLSFLIIKFVFECKSDVLKYV